MNRYSSPDMTRPNTGTNIGTQRRRPWWIVPVASGLAAAVVIAAVIYVLTRPSVAGNWVGPGNFQGGNDASVAIAAYMRLEQQFGGAISGTGELCANSAQGIVQEPVDISGSMSGSSVQLALHTKASAPASTSLPLAAALELSGTLVDGELTLSGSSPPGVLTLQQGSQSDYTAACGNLPTTEIPSAA
jgi:hypothetical protein